MKTPSFKKRVKNLPRTIGNAILLSPIILEDYLLATKIKLTKENYIGIYIGICNKNERRILFPNTVAGGYCGYSHIKIFEDASLINNYEDCALEILNHEVLHQVVGEINHEARQKLDNIHKRFYVLDCQTNKMRFVVSFCFYRKGHLFLVVPSEN